MALTIYKITSYVNWKATSPTSFVGGGTAGIPTTVDLSQYYTKTNLQTSGEAIVNYENLTGEPTFEMSIEQDSSNVVTLVGDEESPGNSKLYGTDAIGNKGWYDQPVTGGGGGGEVGITGTPADNQIAIWTSSDHIEGQSGLTYDGATFAVTGDVSISSGEATGGDFILSSDARIKKNIEDYIPEQLKIRYRQFELRSKPGQIRYGVIAQEIMDKYPELVRCDKNGILSVSYFDLLVREIAYLKAKVIDLEKRVGNGR